MDLELGHHATDGIEVIDVQGEIDIYTAPRLRELLIDLVRKGSYRLVVNLDKVRFLDFTGLGVLVGSLKPVRAHDGSLNLVSRTADPEILKITGLTEVFGIYRVRTRPSQPRRAPGKEHVAGAAQDDIGQSLASTRRKSSSLTRRSFHGPVAPVAPFATIHETRMPLLAVGRGGCFIGADL